MQIEYIQLPLAAETKEAFNTWSSDPKIARRFEELLASRHIEHRGKFCAVIKTAENILIVCDATGESVTLSFEQFATEMFPHPEDAAEGEKFIRDLRLTRE